MTGGEHIVNHLSVPAACFTHPEISFVGVTEEVAKEKAKEEGFELGVSKTSFKANSKVWSIYFLNSKVPQNDECIILGSSFIQGIKLNMGLSIN